MPTTAFYLNKLIKLCNCRCQTTYSNLHFAYRLLEAPHSRCSNAYCMVFS